MSFGTNASGYREHEMRRQSPVLIGVSLSQQTVKPVEKVLAELDKREEVEVQCRRRGNENDGFQRAGVYIYPEGLLIPGRTGPTGPFLSASGAYRAEAATCNACPLKAQCTPSDQGRQVHRSFHASYLERVRTYYQTEAYQKAMRKRKVWVEPLFAEAKDWHGMRRFRLRRLWRVNCEALRIAAGQNLKRLLKKRGWGRRPFPAEAMCAFFFVVSWWMTATSLADVPVSLLLDSGDPVS